MTHDYQPWTGELAVQPVPCPCCGSPAKVWQYVEKPGAEVLRVVMCDGGEMETDGLPVVIDACLLDMPPNAFYSATARQAVATWNLYAESLNARRAAIAGAAPKAEAPAAPAERGVQPLTEVALKNLIDAAEAVVEAAYRMESRAAVGNIMSQVSMLGSAVRAALAAKTAPLTPFTLMEDGAPQPDTPCVTIVQYQPGKRFYATDFWTMQREDPIGMGGPTIETGYGWNDNPHETLAWAPLPSIESVLGGTEGGESA